MPERPYPNEHACRLREPSAFVANSFKRVSRKHDGKTYGVIRGRLKGATSMTDQALRYPIAEWSESSARQHCANHAGKLFEPATGQKELEDDMTQREYVTCDLPLMSCQARAIPDTVDEEARTVELTWTSGAAVRRTSWFDGPFEEKLILTPSAVKMDRLNNGAPLLNSHRGHDLDRILGVVERAWLEGQGDQREGRAVVRFSEREEVEPVWRDVASGIIRSVSVGYRILRIRKTERENDVPLVEVLEWEPLELSMVAIPADDQAKVRSDVATYRCVMETRKMLKKTTSDAVTTEEVVDDVRTEDETEGVEQTQEDARSESEEAPRKRVTIKIPDTPTYSQADVEKRVAEELAAEQERQDQIRTAARVLKFDDTVAERLIKSGVAAPEAFRELHKQAAERQAALDAISGPRITEGDHNENDMLARSVTSAILHRHNPAAFKLEYNAPDFVGMSLLEIARYMLEDAGVKTRGLGRNELAKRAMTMGYGVRAMHTTTDFANILADVSNKTLRRAYDEQPRTFTSWARRSTAPDFKNINRPQLGEAPSLMMKNEHGEFMRGTISEANEPYKLITYGRVFGITREVIINDDLDAFTRIPAQFGSAAARKESDVVYAVLLANANMGDGTPLFDANHGNLSASPAPPTIASLSEARSDMSKQTGLDGVLINVSARTVLSPPELETEVEQLINGIMYPASPTDVVPASFRSLQPVSEPRLSVGVTLEAPGGTSKTEAGSATAWYVIGDPGQIDTVEYAFLEGEEGVMIDSRVGFDVDGVEVRARLDFGAKALDWRAMYKNAGA